MQEHYFQTTPDFKAIDASYIADDLKDFLTVAWTIPTVSDWSDLIQFFKTTRGTEPIKVAHWNKIVTRLSQMKQAKIFEMIIQLATKDPFYEASIDEKREFIVSPYIEKVRSEAISTVRKLENEQKNSKIDSLLSQIFNTTAIFATKHYTEEGSEVFVKRGLPPYEFAKPLNYLKSFLIEFVKKDVRELADLVLVRGKWTNPELSQQMSEAYNSIMEASEKITAFDNKHNEEGGEFGIKFKTLLPRCERDRESKNILRTLINDSNATAKEYVVKTTKQLIVFAKDTKSLIDDYKKLPRAEMLTNWKELEASHELAYFRGSLAVEFPESYTLEEMKAISEGMEASTAEIDAALRADFQAMPVFAQQRMMELLEKADPDNIRFWEETLLGISELPDSPPVTA